MFECRTEGLEFFETAPQKFTFVTELPVTPARLFEVFEDPESWPAWAPGLKKVTWTSDKPFGVGTTRTVELVNNFEVYETFIAWQEDRMSFVLTGHNQKVWWAMGEDYRLTDLGDGRTRLAWTIAYDPRGVFRAIHPFIKFGMGWTLGRIVRGLEKYVAALPDVGESKATDAASASVTA